jgi:uncharacterized membrane protein
MVDEHAPPQVIGPGWVLGSILTGVAVAALLAEGGEVATIVAIGVAVAAVLLAIGFAAEKVVLAIERTGPRSDASGPGAGA